MIPSVDSQRYHVSDVVDLRHYPGVSVCGGWGYREDRTDATEIVVDPQQLHRGYYYRGIEVERVVLDARAVIELRMAYPMLDTTGLRVVVVKGMSELLHRDGRTYEHLNYGISGFFESVLLMEWRAVMYFDVTTCFGPEQ